MKRALVTGATGFIGGRLAEVLVAQGVEVVALVRRWGSASRLSRLPVRMVGGDVLDPPSLREASTGCDVVFHCAVDFRTQGGAHKRSSAEGTGNVLRAALDAGASRVVHLSSAAVHGLSPKRGTAVEEGAPLRRVGHDYCDGKIAAEGIVRDFQRRHGLPVTILRPTVVYGPFGSYSASPARVAREGRLLLVDGAGGVCNALYVDDLVQAILLAAVRSEAVGQIFNVSGPRPLTWREYLEGHAAALGPDFVPLPVVSRRALEVARRRLRNHALRTLAGGSIGHPLRQLRDPAIKQGFFLLPGATWGAGAGKSLLATLPAGLRDRIRGGLARAKATGVGSRAGAASAALPAIEGPIQPTLSRVEEESFSVFSQVTFPIEKARALLGFDPAVDFETGMARTAQWIRWAGI